MSIKDDKGLMEKYTELMKIGSMKISISRDQVSEIVVAELILKYKAIKKRNDEYTESFAKVLRFYLTEEEFMEIDTIEG